jgi:hypothetical protein
MLRKLVKRLRLPMPTQILGRGDQCTPADRQSLDDQTPVADWSVPHDRVVTLRYYVHEPIVKLEGQLETWEFRQQAKQCRSQMQTTETDRRRNSEIIAVGIRAGKARLTVPDRKPSEPRGKGSVCSARFRPRSQ